MPIRGQNRSQAWPRPTDFASLTSWLQPTVSFVGGAAGSWQDGSGHSFTAQGNGASIGATGINGVTAITFDGTGNLSGPSLATFISAASQKVTAFVVIKSATVFAPSATVYQQPGILADGTAGGGYFGFYAATDTEDAFVWDGVQRDVVISVPNGSAHVLAMRLDSTLAANQLTGWIDTTKQASTASGAIQVNTNPVVIGTQWQGLRYTGLIGDIAIFNDALSDGVVNALIWFFGEKYKIFADRSSVAISLPSVPDLSARVSAGVPPPALILNAAGLPFVQELTLARMGSGVSAAPAVLRGVTLVDVPEVVLARAAAGVLGRGVFLGARASNPAEITLGEVARGVAAAPVYLVAAGLAAVPELVGVELSRGVVAVGRAVSGPLPIDALPAPGAAVYLGAAPPGLVVRGELAEDVQDEQAARVEPGTPPTGLVVRGELAEDVQDEQAARVEPGTPPTGLVVRAEVDDVQDDAKARVEPGVTPAPPPPPPPEEPRGGGGRNPHGEPAWRGFEPDEAWVWDGFRRPPANDGVIPTLLEYTHPEHAPPTYTWEEDAPQLLRVAGMTAGSSTAALALAVGVGLGLGWAISRKGGNAGKRRAKSRR